MEKISKDFKKLVISVVGTLVIILSGIWLFVSSGSSLETIKVEQRDITSSIELVGTVKTVKDLNLGFEVSGKVKAVNVAENEFIKAGDTIIELETNDLVAQRAQANGELSEAQSLYEQQLQIVELEEERLIDIKEGRTTTEIDLARAGVETSKASLEQAKSDLEQTEKSAETNTKSQLNLAKNQINGSIDMAVNFLYNLTNLQFEVYPTVSSNSVQVDYYKGISAKDLLGIEDARRVNNKILSDGNGGLRDEFKSVELVEPLEALNYINQTKSILQNINNGFSSFAFETEATQSITESINNNRNNVVLEIEKLSNLENSINSTERDNESRLSAAKQRVLVAENQLTEAEKNLANVQAGPRDTEINIQERQIEQAKSVLQSRLARVNIARAKIASVQAEISKRRILAPIDGWIQSLEFGVGEIVGANQNAVRLIAENELLVEVDMPERYIGSIENGKAATIQLESLKDTFEGKIVRIDRESTFVNNVPIFKVEIKISEPTDKVRSGMTGDVEIIFDSKNGVLAIPKKMIQTDEKSTFVEVVRSYKPLTIEKINIETGLEGNDSWVEVTEGLKGDEEIYKSNQEDA